MKPAAVVARHSAAQSTWQTPPEIIAAARATMGGIDLDPASCASANDRVGAAAYFDEAHDGLRFPWDGRVFLNPPGGKCDAPSRAQNPKRELVSVSAAPLWWGKLAEEWLAGRTLQAIFVGFSIEILQTSQGIPGVPSAAAFPMCIPRRRLAFVDPATGQAVKGNTHASVVVYLPPPSDGERARARFLAAFEPIGQCVPGLWSQWKGVQAS